MKYLAFTLALATPAIAQENPIDTIRPDAPELAAYGDYAVGVQTMTFTRPDVIDVVNSTEDQMARYDREITVEVFYPAAEGTEPGGTYTAILRDGETEVTLSGQGVRDAAPAEGSFPLVLISHGYPGNRFLMAHLAENLASKGYVTASIDHPDSTYSDMGAFPSTLYNRPQDQSFVLDQMAQLDGDLGQIVDAEQSGLVGYSMGGYGSLIFAGGALTDNGWPERYNAPGGILSDLGVGADLHEDIQDDRLSAVVAIGPWGRNRDFWNEEGLSQIDTPLMIVAGSVDDVSEYDAIHTIFDETTGTTRHLLTFEGANHNAAAPYPAPEVTYSEKTDVFGHYADAVWDTTRMNNILQHFVTAFMDLHLKGDQAKADYLDLTENAEDGTTAMEDGQPTEDHTYWTGFPDRTAKALRFETLEAE